MTLLNHLATMVSGFYEGTIFYLCVLVAFLLILVSYFINDKEVQKKKR